MIPLPVQDTVRTSGIPFVNLCIVAACALVFVWIQYLLWFESSAAVFAILDTYGLIPARLLRLLRRGELGAAELYLPLLVSPFLHVSFLHFVSNMFFLWVLGDGLEGRLGHRGYALLYAVGAVVASLAHVAANPSSRVPALGASGGIAAVMGAYLLLYPKAWIEFRLAPFPWPRLSFPALLVLSLWIALQLGAVTLGGESGIAWWAHVGGFGLGMVAAIFARARSGRRRPRGRKRRSRR